MLNDAKFNSSELSILQLPMLPCRHLWPVRYAYCDVPRTTKPYIVHPQRCPRSTPPYCLQQETRTLCVSPCFLGCTFTLLIYFILKKNKKNWTVLKSKVLATLLKHPLFREPVCCSKSAIVAYTKSSSSSTIIYKKRSTSCDNKW